MECKTKNKNNIFYEALIYNSINAHKILIEILEDEQNLKKKEVKKK